MNGPEGPVPDIDLADVTDGRVLAIGRVPANSRVLDIEPTDPSVARCLREMGCEVWCVGQGSDALESTEPVYEKVIRADLNTPDFAASLAHTKFDVVLLFDALEYMSNPAELLSMLPAVLAERGWVVIALPSVASAGDGRDIRSRRPPPAESVPTDPSRLRTYDRPGIVGLLEVMGWRVFDVARVVGEATPAVHRGRSLHAEPSQQPESSPDVPADQLVFTVAPRESTVHVLPPVLPAATAQTSLLRALDRLDRLEEEVRALPRHHVPDLMNQLDEMREMVLDRKSKLKDILAAMREP